MSDCIGIVPPKHDETKPDRCPFCGSNIRWAVPLPPWIAKDGTLCTDPWHDAPTPAPQDEAAEWAQSGHDAIDHLQECIATLETENASLLKRATEAENSASAANARSLIKRAEAAERERDEARELYDEAINEGFVVDTPPWRQGR